MKKIIAFTMICAVSACDAEGNLGEEGSPLWYKRTSIEEQIAYFKPNCIAYGFADPSPEMSICIQNEMQEAKASARENYNASKQRREDRMSQRLKTTCTTVGGFTNCY